jgi:4-carboxymuconolactone decarboxylase
MDGRGGAAAPRITPLATYDEDVRARLAKTPQPDGHPLNLFTTLAHHPRLLSRISALGGGLMFQSALGDRERELVVLRTAGRAHARYEIEAHRGLGAAAGLTDEEIDAALDITSTHTWTARDAALLTVVDEVSIWADVTDESWAGLDGILDDAGRLELLVLVGFYRLLAGVLNGARVAVDAPVPVAS